MSAAHTPAPWHVYPRWPDRFAVGDYNGGKGPYRALVDCSPRRCVDANGDHTPTDEECAANARLIAAAPELLAALQGIAKDAEEFALDACADVQEGGTGSAYAKWDAVRAAIAKATGGAA